MSEEEMSKALDTIHDEAILLLQYDLPEEVIEKLNLIVSLARYKHDDDSSHENQHD
jgi:hypothetical protein